MVTNCISFPRSIQHCLNDVQHKFYDFKEKTWDQWESTRKAHFFLVIGRVLQAAAAVSLTVSVVSLFTFTLSPLASYTSAAILVGSIALLTLGIFLASESPQLAENLLKMPRPFVPGQPIGLPHNDHPHYYCNNWLRSTLQLLIRSPFFRNQLLNIPECAQFLDTYFSTQAQYQKVAYAINTRIIRQAVNRETSGQIADDHRSKDPSELFEYLFQGENALYQLEQQIDGAPSSFCHQSMLSLDLQRNPDRNLQQLFNNYFDHTSDEGRRIQHFFSQSPEELILHVKRFYQEPHPQRAIFLEKKINDSLQIDETLSLPSCFVRSGQSENYVCDGFLKHRGANKERGFYECYLKIENRWWYLFDSQVRDVPESEALNAMRLGYIFHYSRT